MELRIKTPNITFKSLLQDIKDIEERNAYFDYLSDEGKRLEIAWDAMQMILSRKILGLARYRYWDTAISGLINSCNDAKQFQKELVSIKPEAKCNVCARGAMMLSQIRLGNSLFDENFISQGTPDIIKGFSFDDFKQMEDQFEMNKHNNIYSFKRSHTIPEREIVSTNNLLNILCNVLVNGNYNPEDVTDYLI